MHKLAVLVLVGLTMTLAQEPDARCPAVNTRPPTHLAHETDCGLFYLCHLGNRFLMPRCPAGKLFEQAASACMPSSQDPATCVPSTTPPATTTVPPTTVPGETTDLPTTEPATTDGPTTVPNEPPTAPSKTSNFVHLFFS